MLLIACANVASLLLTRAVDREKELAIRRALGAGRLRLARQLLVESLLLGVGGGTVALVIAVWSIDLLLAIGPDSISHWNEVRIDPKVLLFTAAVSLATAHLAGVFPAFQAGRTPVPGGLRPGDGALTGPQRNRGLRGVLVVAEIALAVVLLIGSGLLIRSFARLLEAPAGYQAEDVLIANIYLPEGRYPEDHRQLAFFRHLVERVQALPGVVAAAVTTAVPLDPVSVDFDLPFVMAACVGWRPSRRPRPWRLALSAMPVGPQTLPYLRPRPEVPQPEVTSAPGSEGRQSSGKLAVTGP